ncbi:54S ribosomal protein L4, mitochondrial [Hypsizygus marmoreus]|uniref:Large ribosomal subunit protein uL29m n=1 Tax=Hypsizygus marmoreus TaxID=39966 RepID=A0A369JGQ8_HYPMA|nr:54S ribosomal protein L4, mitochondrial [Hypsizygus marmoreus]
MSPRYLATHHVPNTGPIIIFPTSTNTRSPKEVLSALMLSLARAVPKRVSGFTFTSLTTRSFAEVETRTSIASQTSSQSSVNPTALKGRISVREDHGLYAFFRQKDEENLIGDAKYEVVETPEKMQKETGRAWKASELRLKSFSDLHTLWYILLRERNLLATQKEETRRMGVTNTESQVSLNRVHQCRKSMARIKAVINERRLAYEGAVKIAEEQREVQYNAEVQQHLKGAYRTERRYLQRRQAYMAKKLEAHQRKADERAKAAGVTLAQDASSTPPPTSSKERDVKAHEPSPTPSKEVEVATDKDAPTDEAKVSLEADTNTRPKAESANMAARGPVDTASAALFGTVGASSKRRT